MNLADAYRLLADGQEAMADLQMAGWNLDVPALRKEIKDYDRRIEAKTKELMRLDVVQRWRAIKGKKFKLDGPQLGSMLADVVRKKLKLTSAGRAVIDEDALKDIDHPLAAGVLELRKLQKIRATYLMGLYRERVGDVVHPFFNLHLVRTYRGSSEDPNLQNQPVRDPVQGKIVRSKFIPPRGQQLGEIDLKGAEVCVAYCYHKDPTMKKYLTDPTKDMHRDMAMECYLIDDPAGVSKKTRYCGKNGFVFPAFYGSYWAQIAPSMWSMIDEHALTLPDGTGLREHLKRKGIARLGRVLPNGKPEPDTFHAHIAAVEKNFWYKRFPVYRKWKEQWYADYQRRGYFDTLSGFRCSGVMRRNEAVNYPIQGSSFHCLLWTLIQLRKWLIENKMGTRIIGQIHDSMVLTFVPSEVSAVFDKARQLFETEIRKAWPWVIIKLTAEFELAPVNASWHEKEPYALTP